MLNRSREKLTRNAEALVSKGKIERAIKEYRKLLADNPTDTNILNRVGDLYARIEKIDDAARLFTQIAEQYTNDGFFVKAIAIYKKIIKLEPSRLSVYERLAELYARQNLTTEARTQYQVLADYYLRHDNPASAISIYTKMVDLEPDNPAHHAKLAELYHQQQLIDRALDQYRSIVEILLGEGQGEQATQVYERALSVVDSEDAADFVRQALARLQREGEKELAARLRQAAVVRFPEIDDLLPVVGVGLSGTAAHPAVVDDEPVAEAAVAEGAATPRDETPSAAQLIDDDDDDPTGWQEAESDSYISPPEDIGDSTGSAFRRELPGQETMAVDLGDQSLDTLSGDAGDFAASEDLSLDGSSAEIEDTGAFGGDGFEIEIDLGDDLKAGFDGSAEVDEALGLDAGDLGSGGLDAGNLGSGDLGSGDVGSGDLGAGDFASGDLGAGEDGAFAAAEGEQEISDEDYLSEAEVLAKYGLKEKALERIREVLDRNPQSRPAYRLMIQMRLNESDLDQARMLAERMAQWVTESGGREEWEKIDGPLRESGIEIDVPADAPAQVQAGGQSFDDEDSYDSDSIEIDLDALEIPDALDLVDAGSAMDDTGGAAALDGSSGDFDAVAMAFGVPEESSDEIPETAGPADAFALGDDAEAAAADVLSSTPALGELPAVDSSPAAFTLGDAVEDDTSAGSELLVDAEELDVELDVEPDLSDDLPADPSPTAAESELLSSPGFDELLADSEGLTASGANEAVDLSELELSAEPASAASQVDEEEELFEVSFDQISPAAVEDSGAEAAEVIESISAQDAEEPVEEPGEAEPAEGDPGHRSELDSLWDDTGTFPRADGEAPRAAASEAAPAAAAQTPEASPPAAETAAAQPPAAATPAPGAEGRGKKVGGHSARVNKLLESLLDEAPKKKKKKKSRTETALEELLGLSPKAGSKSKGRRSAAPPPEQAAVAPEEASSSTRPLSRAAIDAALSAAAQPDSASSEPVPPEQVPPEEGASEQQLATPSELPGDSPSEPFAEVPVEAPVEAPIQTPIQEVPAPVEASTDERDATVVEAIPFEDPDAEPAPEPEPEPETESSGVHVRQVSLGAPPEPTTEEHEDIEDALLGLGPSKPPPPLPASSEAAAAEPEPVNLDDSGVLDDTGTGWLDEVAASRDDSPDGREALFAEEADFFDLGAELEEELTVSDAVGTEPAAEQSLEEIVEGFKKGVAEQLSDSDYATHLDLGIAYREMGLLDEAIGEFQIAAKSDDLLVECCSMLGVCFMEKGLPELAEKWYTRGLQAPHLNEKDTLALLYELGNLYLSSGDKEKARSTFVEVYGINTHYRDIVNKLQQAQA
ncbi:MAG: tetratricopeptide repeat protein [Acidobacteriota bacterium]